MKETCGSDWKTTIPTPVGTVVAMKEEGVLEGWRNILPYLADAKGPRNNYSTEEKVFHSGVWVLLLCLGTVSAPNQVQVMQQRGWKACLS